MENKRDLKQIVFERIEEANKNGRLEKLQALKDRMKKRIDGRRYGNDKL